jgi:hypothetical protein
MRIYQMLERNIGYRAALHTEMSFAILWYTITAPINLPNGISPNE